MKYQNPIIRGFYPDPSVCYGNGHFYLVTSSFQYFPGVPLFESDDLVNWRQIGHVLTRESQVMLDKVRASGGVFAPTIRFFDGRFYMVTNNNSTNENFYVYTDDIYGEWSDPVKVDRDGIDPSLLFDEGKVYFLSNGTDDEGKYGIIQCEIDIKTGKKLSASRRIWTGSGGRFIESPHMYHIGNYYYLMVAEGGTEYGHMVTYARSDNPWGPFDNYSKNPVLTNRDKAPFIFQGIGHGDLIQKPDGSWYIVTLGFRQIATWEQYHHLGRETFLAPVSFSEDGWFTCGDGTMALDYEMTGDFEQERKNLYTFENTSWDKDWVFLRKHQANNYFFDESCVNLRGSKVTLDDVDSPTFIGIRQIDFQMNLEVDVTLTPSKRIASLDDSQTMKTNEMTSLGSSQTTQTNETASLEDLQKILTKKNTCDAYSGVKSDDVHGARVGAGVTIYMSEREHYDIFLRPDANGGMQAVLRFCVGPAKQEKYISVGMRSDLDVNTSASADKNRVLGFAEHDANATPVRHATLRVKSTPTMYEFFVVSDGREISLGSADSKYLSSETSGGFTGVMIGLFAEGDISARFEKFRCEYNL